MALESILAKLLAGLRVLRGALAWLLTTLFGEVDWYAPDWLRFLGLRLKALGARLAAIIRAQPHASALAVGMVIVLAGSGYAGWRWWQARPKPVEISYTVQAPGLTCYDCEPVGAPWPLQVSFSDSVAPLQAVGKNLDPARSGIELQPALAGQWSWQNDRTLKFQPAQDWPIGQRYEVEFAQTGFVAPHIHLKQYEFEFATPAFTVRIADTQFYQDPVVATDKKAVFTVGFSHPVDAEAFESRLALAMFNRVTRDQEEAAGDVAYTVSYDKRRLNAYVHSAQLTVPSKQGRLALTVGEGVQAARGGNATPEPLAANVVVPGLNSLAVNSLRLEVARDERDDPKQVLLADLSFSVAEKELPAKLHAWLLPLKHPDARKQAEFEKYHKDLPFDWVNCACLGEAYGKRVAEGGEPLALTQVPGELEHYELHSYSYAADPGRYVYARIDKGLKSFGGYVLGETYENLLRVPEYPRELRVMAEGSLMAMSGPKLLNVFTRDVPAMRVQVQRLLPQQLQHLVTQTGGHFSQPEFQNWQFDASNITEHFEKVETLPRLKPGLPNYTGIDLGQYLKDGGDRRGVFLLRLQAWDTDNARPLYGEGTDEYGNSGEQELGDTRLVVITDLGLLVKRNLDGSQDVFVQSIHSGEPVAGVVIDVLGKNGQPVLTQTSDDQGHVRFASLKDFQREQQPVLYLARKDGDSSFLPIDGRVRQLDLSRFEVGGVANTTDRNALSAYLFSDRGLYRPGEEIRVGMIVKSQDWKPLKDVPLIVQISDPRGAVVKEQAIALGAAGFDEIRHGTQAASPSGNYTINVYIDRKQKLIGSLAVQVREFQPDRLKMSAQLSAASVEGWVSPQELKAKIELQNLFGTPAQSRRVTAQMTLTPSFPAFRAWADYRFHDPQAARESFNEELAETTTGEDGSAEFDLKLQRFAKATYRLLFVAQGFEADGGRGVAAQAQQLVSSMPYLVGWKADGDLGYVSRLAQRSVALIAIDPKTQPAEVRDLKLSLLQIVYASVLVKQNNGTYKYESRRKEVSLEERALTIPAAGSALALKTTEPGSYAYVLRDADGTQMARIDYEVAGDANLTRSLEKNAELKLVLSRKDYAPGEEVEVQITAPYTGSGLITIERDKVYAWKWFSASTTASTQRIRLPEGIEGNAYVNVSFVRDPGSPEVYMSPLSYGVEPFSIALGARRNALSVTAPDRVKPGETVKFRYRSEQPSRVVLFAVDEGILQVARYTAPDPLAHFFQKRSLDVSTRQILDLILPEFRSGAMNAAPGGDAEALLGQHLNPFKRKGDKPVAWWSGIVDADANERELSYVVPDYFNGTLRVFAVAVSDEAVGVHDGRLFVRGDFVLSPNAPTVVAPGDEFEVSVGVANNAEGSGKDAKLAVSLATTPGLQVLGEKSQSLAVAERSEGSASFRLKATRELGPADLQFSVKLGDKSASRKIDLSVRPPIPYRVELSAGSVKPGKRIDLPVTRTLYAQHRELEAGMSMLPLALAHGFVSYLDRYPYSCTEQLMSMAMPAIVLGDRPEFGTVKSSGTADFAGLIDELRSRQNPDGAYRYWPGAGQVQEFVSIYAQHGLLEAAERGHKVPRELMERGNDWLRGIARRDGDSLEQERNTAYALYLLVRQGNVMGAEAAGLQQRLEQRYEKEWKTDLAAAYLAAALQMMKQTREADAMIGRIPLEGDKRYDRWHDPMVSDASLLYLLARHFPQRLAKLPPVLMEKLVERTQAGLYHSLSAGTTLLALDAYARAAGDSAINAKFTVSELLRDGKTERPLSLPDTLLPKAAFGADVRALRYDNRSDYNAYYIASQSGFDLDPPKQAIVKGFEILREYTDAAGKPVSSVKIGQEIDVHLKFRAVERGAIDDAALIDLLPGGFELVVQPQEVQQQFLQASQREAEPVMEQAEEGGEEGEYEGEDEPQTDWGNWACPVCVAGTSAWPGYADFREDRVVFYAPVTTDVREIVYRIKATNAGIYAVPPAYGESMYERQVQAQSLGASITVERP